MKIQFSVTYDDVFTVKWNDQLADAELRYFFSRKTVHSVVH